MKVVQNLLTICTSWPLRLTKLIVWQASQSVVILREVICESVVMATSIAFVQDSLIMGWGVIFVPGQ